MFDRNHAETVIICVKEHNRTQKTLQEIKEIAEKINVDNFDAYRAELIAVCQKALKRRSPRLTKKQIQFLDKFEERFEVIDDGGEYFEKFQD